MFDFINWFKFFSVGQNAVIPEITYAGYIFDDVGNPIVNASVLVVDFVDQRFFEVYARSYTDQNGKYEIVADAWHRILAYKNDTSTPRFDYYPSSKIFESYLRSEVNGGKDVNENLTLVPAASINLKGVFNSVQSEIVVLFPRFLNQGVEVMFTSNNKRVAYEYARINIRNTLGLENTIIAPAGAEFYLELNGYEEIPKYLDQTHVNEPDFIVDTELYDDDPIILQQGELIEYDITGPCLGQDLNEMIQDG